MWKNFKFLHMTDVEKSEILHIWHVFDEENVATYGKFMLFCCKIRFVTIYAICCKICFVAIYALLCGEKWQIWGLSTMCQRKFSPTVDPEGDIWRNLVLFKLVKEKRQERFSKSHLGNSYFSCDPTFSETIVILEKKEYFENIVRAISIT